MFGKQESLKLISEQGKLNPMFGKVQSESTKEKISDRMSKYPEWVDIYAFKLLFIFN